MKSELKEGYYPSGELKYQRWFFNGELHNESGPACFVYYEDGKIKKQLWRLNGQKYTKEEFRHYQLIKEMAGIK